MVSKNSWRVFVGIMAEESPTIGKFRAPYSCLFPSYDRPGEIA
jgi:hypothetical protein